MDTYSLLNMILRLLSGQETLNNPEQTYSTILGGQDDAMTAVLGLRTSSYIHPVLSAKNDQLISALMTAAANTDPRLESLSAQSGLPPALLSNILQNVPGLSNVFGGTSASMVGSSIQLTGVLDFFENNRETLFNDDDNTLDQDAVNNLVTSFSAANTRLLNAVLRENPQLRPNDAKEVLQMGIMTGVLQKFEAFGPDGSINEDAFAAFEEEVRSYAEIYENTITAGRKVFGPNSTFSETVARMQTLGLNVIGLDKATADTYAESLQRVVAAAVETHASVGVVLQRMQEVTAQMRQAGFEDNLIAAVVAPAFAESLEQAKFAGEGANDLATLSINSGEFLRTTTMSAETIASGIAERRTALFMEDKSRLEAARMAAENLGVSQEAAFSLGAEVFSFLSDSQMNSLSEDYSREISIRASQERFDLLFQGQFSEAGRRVYGQRFGQDNVTSDVSRGIQDIILDDTKTIEQKNAELRSLGVIEENEALNEDEFNVLIGSERIVNRFDQGLDFGAIGLISNELTDRLISAPVPQTMSERVLSRLQTYGQEALEQLLVEQSGRFVNVDNLESPPSDLFTVSIGEERYAIRGESDTEYLDRDSGNAFLVRNTTFSDVENYMTMGVDMLKEMIEALIRQFMPAY